MSNAIDIQGLCKHFPKFTLKDISFQLQEGYIMGMIGPNGAGKTSVIKLILNMLKKDSGQVQIFGLDHIDREMDIKENIGVVYEQTYYLKNWTLNELEASIKPFYKTWNSNRFHAFLKDFGLYPKQKINTLSKGMNMKLMIAAALSHETKLLILDEPTSGLDAVSRDELLDILRNYVISEDKSILFSSHITADLEKTADYITFLHQGELIYTGTKDGLLEKYCMIKGDLKDIKDQQRSQIIGLTQYANGFEGLFPTDKLGAVSGDIITDPASLDDIILFTDRDRKKLTFNTER